MSIRSANQWPGGCHVNKVDPGDRGIPLLPTRSETGPRSREIWYPVFQSRIKEAKRSVHGTLSVFMISASSADHGWAERRWDESSDGPTWGSEYLKMDSLTCSIWTQLILSTEKHGRTKCCYHFVHFNCFTQALDDQLNKGVISEKLYCPLCHSLCLLSYLVAILDWLWNWIWSRLYWKYAFPWTWNRGVMILYVTTFTPCSQLFS